MESGQTSQNRLNRVLAEILKGIDAIEAEADRNKFRRALRYSVDGDGLKPPKIIHSPHDIAANTGISIREQFDYGIIVDRNRAIEFLASLRYSLRPHSLRKKLSPTYWQSNGLFPNREIAKVSNSLVFTYREILIIEERTFTSELTDYLSPHNP